MNNIHYLYRDIADLDHYIRNICKQNTYKSCYYTNYIH